MRFVLALVLASTPALAEPGQYLCLADQSGGVDFNRTTHVWEGRGFKTDAKYILRPLREAELDTPFVRSGKWSLGFFKFGGNALAYCKENGGGRYNDFAISWECTRYPIDLQISKESLRFQAIYPGGYFEQGSAEQLRQSDPERYRRAYGDVDVIDKPDSAAIEIGKCSPL